MEYLIIFCIGLILAIIGSLQPGPVNSYVFLYSKKSNIDAANRVAMGGSLVQGIVASLALALIIKFDFKLAIPNIFAAMFLIALGLFFFGKSKTLDTLDHNESKKYFLQGIGFAIANPQVIMYWTLVSTIVCQSINIFGSYSTFYFGIGAYLGTFIALTIYKKLGTNNMFNQIDNRLIYNSLGLFFIIAGFIKLLSI